MRQGFVVGALVVTAIACGSFAADALWHFDEGDGLVTADFGPAKLTATMPDTTGNQPKWVQIACVSELPPP